MKKQDLVCLMPWVHLHIRTNGDVTPCCLNDEVLGNINQESLCEIWNGKKIRNFRLKMISNEVPIKCISCFKNGKLTESNLRSYVNKKYYDFLEDLNNTSSKGFVNSQPVYWDIRFSNMCNFKCRTCGYLSSSRWYKDANLLGDNVCSEPLLEAFDDFLGFFNQNNYQLKNLKEFYFAGGEPLLMKEHYYILKFLLECNNTSIHLRYNTNLSTLKYKDIDVVRIWKRFKSITIGASVDSFGKQSEFIRKGQDYNRVIANRKRIQKELPWVKFHINTTVSILNILHIPMLHKLWVENELIEIDGINLNLLEEPDFYNIKNLTKELKNQVTKEWDIHIKWIERYKKSFGVRIDTLINKMQSCIKFMLSEDYQLKEEFSKYNFKLDEIRNESTYETFPELSEMK